MRPVLLALLVLATPARAEEVRQDRAYEIKSGFLTLKPSGLVVEARDEDCYLPKPACLYVGGELARVRAENDVLKSLFLEVAVLTGALVLGAVGGYLWGRFGR